MKMKIPKPVRNILISIITIVVLFVVAGVLYVLITGRQTVEQKKPSAAGGDIAPLSAPIKPSPPNPKAPEGVAQELLTSPVAPGANASMTIRAVPTSKCSINVSYNNVVSKDSGLTDKIADAYGSVTWSWTVDQTAAVGTWPVKVTCVYNGRSGVVIGNLQVAK